VFLSIIIFVILVILVIFVISDTIIRKTSNLSLASLSLELTSLSSSLRDSVFGSSLAHLCLWTIIFVFRRSSLSLENHLCLWNFIFVFVKCIFASLKNIENFSNEIGLMCLWEVGTLGSLASEMEKLIN
jgi:hypothetical protein